MTSIIETAITASQTVPPLTPTSVGAEVLHPGPQPNASPASNSITERVKYRHLAAYHSRLRTSCLSRDSEATPSFLGFRNLMVIVLGEKRLRPQLNLFTDLTICSCHEFTIDGGKFYEGVSPRVSGSELYF